VSDAEKVFSTFPDAQGLALNKTYDTLHSLLPTATEDLSWGMPTLRCEGIIVVSLVGFRNHNSLFPGPEAIELMADHLEGYVVTKGTIHFAVNKPPPKKFLHALIRARVTAINQGFPKKSGQYLELYGNGVPKARGTYRQGAMQGAWQFYRRDGSLMRSGSFADGKQSGTWVTYDSSGEPYKTTVIG
jgi:uncharacterized protein YdhG (YjbR/CyaY superfamily)